MAKGISPALPLILDETDGPYRLNKTIAELANQNLKMLLLTIPGERVMQPDYGVGLSKYIFENDNGQLDSFIVGKIRRQVSKYLPYISLSKISVSPFEARTNTLTISIAYAVPNIKEIQQLDFVVNTDPN